MLALSFLSFFFCFFASLTASSCFGRVSLMSRSEPTLWSRCATCPGVIGESPSHVVHTYPPQTLPRTQLCHFIYCFCCTHILLWPESCKQIPLALHDSLPNSLYCLHMVSRDVGRFADSFVPRFSVTCRHVMPNAQTCSRDHFTVWRKRECPRIAKVFLYVYTYTAYLCLSFSFFFHRRSLFWLDVFRKYFE